jgi:hypothetical protein
MRIRLAVSGMIFLGIVACAHTGGIEEKEKSVGKSPPVIEKSFASNQLRPGDPWKIYLLASDPDGDMETIIAVVEQPGLGAYPTSKIKIKGENRKELSGYIYLNTSGPFGHGFLHNQELTVSIQIVDKTGHTSQSIAHSVLFLSVHTQKSPPIGVFKEENLGPIMVVLRPPDYRA